MDASLSIAPNGAPTIFVTQSHGLAPVATLNSPFGANAGLLTPI